MGDGISWAIYGQNIIASKYCGSSSTQRNIYMMVILFQMNCILYHLPIPFYKRDLTCLTCMIDVAGLRIRLSKERFDT